MALTLVFAGGVVAPSSARAEWAQNSEGAWGWKEGGTFTGKYIPNEAMQKMEEEAAAGALNGGGRVPKGLVNAQVENGTKEWQELLNKADTTANSSKWQTIKGGAVDLMSREGAVAALNAFGKVAMGASGFQLGWQIGCEISECEASNIFDFFFGSNSEGEANPGGPNSLIWHPVELYPRVRGEELTEGCCSSPERNQLGKIKKSTFQALLVNGNGTETWEREESPFVNPCAESAPNKVWGVPPNLNKTLVYEHETGCLKEGVLQHYWEKRNVWTGLQVECLPKQKTNGCPHSVKETRKTAKPTMKEGAEAKKEALECFKEPVCSQIAAWWYNHDKQAKEATTGTGIGPSSVVEVLLPKPGESETYEEYGKKLEELGVKPNYVEKAPDKTKKPKIVILTKPTWGESVEPESTVTVEWNGAYVPKFGTHEKYTEYDKTVEEYGLKPANNVLGETAIDPSKGPEEVTATEPAPETALKGGSTVSVRYNPATAPPASAGGWSPPTIPSIDLSPLRAVSLGCNKFPFGIFCWFAEGLGSWNALGKAPSVEIPFPGYGHLKVDLSGFEPVMEVVRPVEVIVSTLSIAWLLASSALGFGAGAANED